MKLFSEVKIFNSVLSSVHTFVEFTSNNFMLFIVILHSPGIPDNANYILDIFAYFLTSNSLTLISQKLVSCAELRFCAAI